MKFSFSLELADLSIKKSNFTCNPNLILTIISLDGRVNTFYKNLAPISVDLDQNVILKDFFVQSLDPLADDYREIKSLFDLGITAKEYERKVKEGL